MALSFWKKMFGNEGSEPELTDVDEQSSSVSEGSSSSSDAAGESACSCGCAKAVVESEQDSLEFDDEGVSSVVSAGDVDISGLESFVEYVAKNLVDNPEAVTVSTVEKERISVIQIRCEKKDIGKIIGKSGKTIAAIRLLVSGAGGRMGLRMTVDVLD